MARVLIEGREIACGDISISIDEGSQFWVATVAVLEAADFLAIEANQLFSILFNEELFHFIVDSRQKDLRPESWSMSITGISPEALLATPITRDWPEPIKAKDLVEEILGITVNWQILNWTIPGGRVSVYNGTPMALAASIVAAAGGVLEVSKNGLMLARWRYPVSPQKWQYFVFEADHNLSDDADILAMTETMRAAARGNKVTIRDVTPETGQDKTDAYFSIEIDGRPDGPNKGKREFLPGDTATILVWRGPGMGKPEVSVSAGIVTKTAPQLVIDKLEVEFRNTDQAQLPHPVDQILGMRWLGNSLGTLTLQKDRMTLKAEQKGVAVARVRWKAMADGFRITSPTKVAENIITLPNGQAVTVVETEFPILVHVTATPDQETPGTGGEITVQRGEGEYPLPDILEPVLGPVEAKLARGATEMDAAERYLDVTLTTIPKKGIELGHLVTIEETLQSAWIGKVVGLTYNQTGPVATMTIKLKKWVENVLPD